MGMLNMAISIILPFVSRTIIIYTLGTEYVGLGGLFTSILNVLSLSELGIGAAITYSMYKPIAEGDVDKVNSILSIYRNVYRIIGCIIVLISLCLLPFLDILVSGEIPDGMNLDALFLVYVSNTVISYFLFAYKKVLLIANQRYDIDVNISTIALVLQYVLQIIVLLTTHNYYIYVLVFPIATIINNLISNYVIIKKYPQYRCSGTLDKDEIFGLCKNVSGAFLSKIGNTVYLSVDNIVISAFLGLAILGKYSNYYYIISSLVSVFAIVHNSLRPVLGNSIATETVENNWKYFKNVVFIYMSAVTVCSSCCLILMQDFERLWVGNDNILDFSIVYLLVVYFFTGRMYSILVVYQEAAGIWWYGKFIPLIAAIVNLILNIVGVQFIGLPAILLSSIITSVLISFPGTVWIVFKHYFVEKSYCLDYLKSMVVIIIQAVATMGLSYCVFGFIVVNGWIGLIVKAIMCVILNVLLLIIMNLRNPVLIEMSKRVKKIE